MFKLTWAIALIASLGAFASPACAQSEIQVPATASWKHGETGLILRSQIAGMRRGMIKDSSDSELDVTAQYETADAATSVTLYLFRPALDSVPMWFDRSETQVLIRDTYGRATPLAEALAFAPPRATALSGLRRVYVPSKGPYRSTGLVMMPLGKWLVAVRISSQSVDPAALDALMSQFIAGLGWPEGVAESPTAAAIAACPSQLAYAGRAKLKKRDAADGILGSMMVAIGDSDLGLPKDPAVFCRDLPPQGAYAVYRNPAATDSYVMALGDAGLVVRILPQPDSKTAWMVIVGFLDHASVYQPFEKLPHPEDVMKALRTTQPLAQVSLDGKNITLSMP